MSKTSKRKSGGDSSKSSKSSVKDSHKRPSVFERLGTKASTASVGSLSVNVTSQLEFCRAWAQNGSCPFGKSCKLSYSHILISPSKRSLKKEESEKRGGGGSLVGTGTAGATGGGRGGGSARGGSEDRGGDWEAWDQTDLEYEDEKALERRRQLLQRELELQMKKETQKQLTSRRRSSSTSSDSSSTSSSTTSSGSTSDSSLSSKKRIETKIQSPSLLERSIIIKKTMAKGSHKESSPPRKSSASSKKISSSPGRKSSSRRKSVSPPLRKQLTPPPPPSLKSSSSSKLSTSKRSSERTGRRGDSPTERKEAVGRGGGAGGRRSRERGRRSPRSLLATSRNRSPDRRKEEERRGSERKDEGRRREDRKSEFRDKRESAREKERAEALERCRERQREREALAKERERKANRRGGGFTRRSPLREDKRHDRKTDDDRSYSRERVRDRALERMIERRPPSSERSYDRSYLQASPSYNRGDRGGRYTGERTDSPGGEQQRRGDERRVRGGRGWQETGAAAGGGSKPGGGGQEGREWSGEHRDWGPTRHEEQRGGDDWYGGGRSESRTEWRSRSHLSHHDDRRSHHTEKDKDHSSEHGKEKDSKEAGITLGGGGLKRPEEREGEPLKRQRLEDVTLQEELSDISDDPDDILNQEDESFPMETEPSGEPSIGGKSPQESQPLIRDEGSHHPSTAGPSSSSERNMECRLEDDAIVSLDFEEISDEELEEESKSNKGVSVADALGADWSSLVAEWRPSQRGRAQEEFSARERWYTAAVFKRLGISQDLAGPHLAARICNTYLTRENASQDSKAKSLPSALLQNKQALSARTDIIIRRQLCGLPVISSETHPTTGLCQWAV